MNKNNKYPSSREGNVYHSAVACFNNNSDHFNLPEVVEFFMRKITKVVDVAAGGKHTLFLTGKFISSSVTLNLNREGTSVCIRNEWLWLARHWFSHWKVKEEFWANWDSQTPEQCRSDILRSCTHSGPFEEWQSCFIWWQPIWSAWSWKPEHD